MRRDQAVYWNQGLFLTAQHLQQQDLFHQTQLGNLWGLLGPHGWGVRHLEIRRSALATGVFDVVRCHLVSRDGRVLRAGTGESMPNARIEPRSFDHLPIGPHGGVGVYAVLPRYLPRTLNIAPDGGAGETAQYRWRLESEAVPDLYDPQSQPADITFLSHELTILFGTEPAFANTRARCEIIRIAELVMAEKGAELSAVHIAPCVSLDSSERLLTVLKDLVSRITRRAQDFADLKRDRGIRGSAASPQDLMRTLILSILNRHAVELRMLIEQPWMHPQTAYALLCRMVAELSSFSEDYTLFGASAMGDGSDSLPPYDHERIAPGMDQAVHRIDAILKRLSVGPEAAIPLELDNELFTNAEPLPDDFFKGDSPRYYLVIESDMRGADLSEALFSTGKLSSPGDMAALRMQHLFGLPVEYLPVPPEELPQRSSRYVYFRLNTSTYHWQNVRKERAIALYSPLLSSQSPRIRLVRTVAE